MGGGKAPNAAVMEQFNKNIAAMKKEAADNGLFMISDDNFVFVIGYRPPGSADSINTMGFQSQLPTAGQNLLDKKLLSNPKEKEPPPPEKGMGK